VTAAADRHDVGCEGRKSRYLPHVLRFRRGIRVEKAQNVARRFARPEIAGGGRAESVVFLSNEAHAVWHSRRHGRSIIDHNDLDQTGGIVLHGERGEGPVEFALLVVVDDDN
jgi:hypothetical protein